MHSSAQQEYLVNEVMTATPQKLHLMLLEEAVRQCNRTRKSWRDGQEEAANEAISKSQEIVTELIASLNFDANGELARRIAAVYNFIFRTLVTAHVRRDEASLGEAIRILEIERDTWRQVCQRTAGQVPPAKPAAPAPLASLGDDREPTTSRLSLEA